MPDDAREARVRVRTAAHTARPQLALEKEPVRRSRLIRLEPRSLVLLSHDR